MDFKDTFASSRLPFGQSTSSIWPVLTIGAVAAVLLLLATATSANADGITAETMVDEAIADGEEEITVTVTAFDENEAPRQGVQITVDATEGVAVDGLAKANTTDEDGEAGFTANSTQAGNVTLSFSDPDGNSDGATATFIPGPVARFDVECEGEHNGQAIHAFAGEPFSCTVTATDAHNNKNPDYAGTVNLTTNATPAPNDEDPELPEDYTFDAGEDEGEKTLAGFTFFRAQTANVTVEDDEHADINGSSPPIRVHPDPQSAMASEIQGDEQNVTVGSLSDPLGANFTDGYGNAYAGYNVTFNVTRAPPNGESYTLNPPNTTANEQGQALSRLRPGTVKGLYVVNATLDARAPLLADPGPPGEGASLTVSFNVTAEPDDPFRVAPANDQIEISADRQDPLILEAQFEDIYGNAIPLPQDTNVTWTLFDDEAGQIDGDELIAGNTSGTYELAPTIDDMDLPWRTGRLVILPGTPTSLEIEADTVRMQTERSHRFDAVLFDAHGNRPDEPLNWTLEGDIGEIEDDGILHANTSGTGTVTVTHNETSLQKNITVHVDDTVRTTEILMDTSPEEPHVGQRVELRIDLLDEEGILVRGFDVDVHLDDPEKGYFPDPGTLVPTRPGSIRLSAAFEDVGNETTLIIDPGPPSQLSIDPPIVAATPGDTINFTTRFFDEYNNPLPAQGEVNWSLHGSQESSINATTGSLELHPEETLGTLSVRATANTTSRTVLVHVTNQTAPRNETVQLPAEIRNLLTASAFRSEFTFGLKRMEAGSTVEEEINHELLDITRIDRILWHAETNLTKPGFIVEYRTNPIGAPPQAVTTSDLHGLFDRHHGQAPSPLVLTLQGTENHSRMQPGALDSALSQVELEFTVSELFFEENALSPESLVLVEYSGGERTGVAIPELRVPVPLQGEYLYGVTFQGSFSTLVALSNQQGPEVLNVSPVGDVTEDPSSFTIELDPLHPLDPDTARLTIGNRTLEGQDLEFTTTRVSAKLDEPLAPGTYDVLFTVEDTAGRAAEEYWSITIPCRVPTIHTPQPGPETTLERTNMTLAVSFEDGGCPIEEAIARLDGEPLTTVLEATKVNVELPASLLEPAEEHQLEVELTNTEQQRSGASWTYTTEEAIEAQDEEGDEEETSSMGRTIALYASYGLAIAASLCLVAVAGYWGWKRYHGQPFGWPEFVTGWRQ